MGRGRKSQWDSPEGMIKRGVCPQCRTFVGKTELLYVRNRKMCRDCGQQEIERVNTMHNGG